MTSTDSYILRQKDTKSFSSANITTRGASLLELVLNGVQVVAQTRFSNPADVVYGTILAPWPNRLADGKFSFDGKGFSFPMDQDGNANHGLVMERRFEVRSHHDHEITVGYRFGEDPNYPFEVDLEICYRLEVDRLVVKAVSTNHSNGAAPFAIGFHPYFVTLEPARLHVDVTKAYETNQRMIPVAEHQIDSLDLTLEPGIKLDHGFRGKLPTAHLEDQAKTVLVRSIRGLDHFMVYRPEESILSSAGSCVAIEPMSAGANQFNTDIESCLIEPGRSEIYEFEIVLASATSTSVTTL